MLTSGLSTKQNRSVPPLQYEVVHRLVTEYPDLQFVLNGGLGSMQQVDAHLGLGPLSCGEVLHSQPLSDYGEENGWGQPVHGCMVGRAVYTNPFMFSQADTRYFGASSDPNLTRGQVLERYFDYCDRVMQEGMEGSGLCDPNPEEQDLVDAATMDVGSRGKSSDDGKVKIGKLLDAAKNVFHGCKGAGRYRQRLKEIYSHSARRRRAGGAFVLGEEVEGCEIDPVRIVSTIRFRIEC
jgi:tRNA-dihydrouridine synthase